MIRFETANGSLYELDEAAGTWRRTRAGQYVNPDAPLRDEGSAMLGHSSVRPGFPVRIWGSSLTPGHDFREIETTPVARVLEPADGAAPAWGQQMNPMIIVSIWPVGPVH